MDETCSECSGPFDRIDSFRLTESRELELPITQDYLLSPASQSCSLCSNLAKKHGKYLPLHHLFVISLEGIKSDTPELHFWLEGESTVTFLVYAAASDY